MPPKVIGVIWSVPYHEDASTGRGGVDGEGESHNRGSDALIQNTFAWGVVINVVEDEKALVVPRVEDRASQDRQHDVCGATVHRNVGVCCQRRKDGRLDLQKYISSQILPYHNPFEWCIDLLTKLSCLSTNLFSYISQFFSEEKVVGYVAICLNFKRLAHLQFVFISVKTLIYLDVGNLLHTHFLITGCCCWSSWRGCKGKGTPWLFSALNSDLGIKT